MPPGDKFPTKKREKEKKYRTWYKGLIKTTAQCVLLISRDTLTFSDNLLKAHKLPPAT